MCGNGSVRQWPPLQLYMNTFAEIFLRIHFVRLLIAYALHLRIIITEHMLRSQFRSFLLAHCTLYRRFVLCNHSQSNENKYKYSHSSAPSLSLARAPPRVRAASAHEFCIRQNSIVAKILPHVENFLFSHLCETQSDTCTAVAVCHFDCMTRVSDVCGVARSLYEVAFAIDGERAMKCERARLVDPCTDSDLMARRIRLAGQAAEQTALRSNHKRSYLLQKGFARTHSKGNSTRMRKTTVAKCR